MNWFKKWYIAKGWKINIAEHQTQKHRHAHIYGNINTVYQWWTIKHKSYLELLFFNINVDTSDFLFPFFIFSAAVMCKQMCYHLIDGMKRCLINLKCLWSPAVSPQVPFTKDSDLDFYFWWKLLLFLDFGVQGGSLSWCI